MAKRNIAKFDIVPLYYDMKKAHAVELNSSSIYEGLNAAFVGGNIGIYSNNISKIWNSDVFVDGSDDEQREAVNIIKLLCMENNFVIDYAKTLYKPTRPDEVNDIINSFTNKPLPHFFKYAKDKNDNQICEANWSFVNKLEALIPNPRLSFKKLGLGSIDCSVMMRNPDMDFECNVLDTGRLSDDGTDPVIVEYCKFDRKYYMMIDSMICSSSTDKNDAYAKRNAKLSMISNEIKESLSKFGYDDYEVCDILVKYLYGIKKSANKTALWLCYGDIILENIMRNIKKKTKDIQCIECGEWFEVSVKDNATCRCESCAKEHKRNLARERKKRQRTKRG